MATAARAAAEAEDVAAVGGLDLAPDGRAQRGARLFPHLAHGRELGHLPEGELVQPPSGVEPWTIDEALHPLGEMGEEQQVQLTAQQLHRGLDQALGQVHRFSPELAYLARHARAATAW